MRRLIAIFAAGLVLLGSLTSCMKLNKEMDYTLGYNYNVNIEDPDIQKEVVDFIESYFINGSMRPTYYGKLHDVAEQATDFFEKEVLNSYDLTEYFFSKLKMGSKEYVFLEGYLSGKYGDCWVGTKVWQWSEEAYGFSGEGL